MRFQDSEWFKKDGGDKSFREGGVNILPSMKMKKSPNHSVWNMFVKSLKQ